jgi:hypothetical protein
VPRYLHALTPASAGRQFLYVAVEYFGADAKIWRRDLDFFDFVISTLYRAMRVVLPLQRLVQIVLSPARPEPPRLGRVLIKSGLVFQLRRKSGHPTTSA